MFSVEEVPTANQIEHEPSKTPEGGTESKYCLSKGETSLKLYKLKLTTSLKLQNAFRLLPPWLTGWT